MFTYYAELMTGSDKWRVVCKNLETEDLSIVGYGLFQDYAEELAERLRASDAASEHCTSEPE